MTSQSNDPVVIASAARTAVGSFGGSLANVPAHDLGAAVIKAVIARAGIKADDVDEVILGQILTAGQGQNPGRQAAINAGCPQTTTAWLINQVCGSGLRAVALAMQQVITGAADIVIAGGQESMSMANHAALLRSGKRMGNIDLIDTMLTDALSEKNATTKVEGCVSQVWLATSTTISPITSKRLMLFRGDSDSMLVRGIIAIMISLYSQQTPNNILAIDYKAKLAELDLLGHLSAQRSNGVYAMINRIRHEAKATQLATDG